ncbi:unnamed protein product [Ectocarpus sp. 6 AP-2014]
MTRVEELARSLVPGAVSTGVALLMPILARKPHSTVAAGPVDSSMASSAFPVLELLVNLSCADPHAIYNWLASCSPDDGSPGGALKGLKIELNSRVEKAAVAPATTRTPKAPLREATEKQWQVELRRTMPRKAPGQTAEPRLDSKLPGPPSERRLPPPVLRTWRWSTRR